MTATTSVFMSRVDQSRARLARFDPGQERDERGRWTDGNGADRPPVDAKRDKLKLAGRIMLLPGDQLIASDKITVRSSERDAVWAIINGPEGAHVRFGLVSTPSQWRARDLGGTALLEPQGMRDFDSNLHTAIGEAKQLNDRMTQIVENIESFDGFDRHSETNGEVDFDDELTEQQQNLIREYWDLASGFAQTRGVLASGPWGDLAYEISLVDAAEAGQAGRLQVAVRPPDSGDDWTFEDLSDSSEAWTLPPNSWDRVQRRVSDLASQLDSEASNG